MILDTTNICTDIQILNIVSIIKSLIGLACIVVPVILVIILMIDVIKTISSNDVDNKKLFKSFSKRIIVAVFIFLIQFIIDFVIGIIPSGKLYYRDCYDKASKQEVEIQAKKNFDASLKQLQDSLIGCTSKEYQCYNDSYLNYEQARKDLKLIPKGDSKDEAEKKLQIEKQKLDNIK